MLPSLSWSNLLVGHVVQTIAKPKETLKNPLTASEGAWRSCLGRKG